MEKLEILETTIAFGENILSLLDERIKDDPAARWLSVHLATLIEESQKITSDLSAPVHQRCLDVLLTLWKASAEFPYELRPFSDWEAVFRVIKALENGRFPSSFWSSSGAEEALNSPHIDERAKEYLTAAIGLSSISSEVVLGCIREATYSMDSQNLEIAKKLEDFAGTPPCLDSIRLILEDEEEAADPKKDRLKELKEKVEALVKMEELVAILRSGFEGEIGKIQSNETVEKESADGGEVTND